MKSNTLIITALVLIIFSSIANVFAAEDTVIEKRYSTYKIMETEQFETTMNERFTSKYTLSFRSYYEFTNNSLPTENRPHIEYIDYTPFNDKIIFAENKASYNDFESQKLYELVRYALAHTRSLCCIVNFATDSNIYTFEQRETNSVVDNDYIFKFIVDEQSGEYTISINTLKDTSFWGEDEQLISEDYAQYFYIALTLALNDVSTANYIYDETIKHLSTSSSEINLKEYSTDNYSIYCECNNDEISFKANIINSIPTE